MVVALHDAVRADQRDLHRLLRQRRRAPVFLERRIAHELETLHHRPTMHDRCTRAGEVRYVPAGKRRAARGAVLVRARVLSGAHLSCLIAAHRQAEAVLEVEPADLAVGEDVQSDRFLQPQVLAYAVELDARELLRLELAGLQPEPRLLPFRRAEQAADDVGADAIQSRGHSWRTPAAFTACA